MAIVCLCHLMRRARAILISISQVNDIFQSAPKQRREKEIRPVAKIYIEKHFFFVFKEMLSLG